MGERLTDHDSLWMEATRVAEPQLWREHNLATDSRLQASGRIARVTPPPYEGPQPGACSPLETSDVVSRNQVCDPDQREQSAADAKHYGRRDEAGEIAAQEATKRHAGAECEDVDAHHPPAHLVWSDELHE